MSWRQFKEKGPSSYLQNPATFTVLRIGREPQAVVSVQETITRRLVACLNIPGHVATRRDWQRHADCLLLHVKCISPSVLVASLSVAFMIY